MATLATMSELTYPEVGATAGDLPLGYHHVRASRELGHGRDVFAAAVEKVLTWQMHRGAGVRVIDAPPRATVGAHVRCSWLGIRIECRVVDVVDEPDRQGFAYGTLPRHPEIGEERFVVEIDPSTELVTARVVAFSKPSGWVMRLGAPVGRLIQKRMTERYLNALLE
jgi:uncharacterized protein (UPF0548 family)